MIFFHLITTKLEGGRVKAVVVKPLKKNFFWQLLLPCSCFGFCHIKGSKDSWNIDINYNNYNSPFLFLFNMRGNKSILNHDAYFMHIYCFIATRINPNSIEGVGGLFTPCDAKFRIKKYPCSHNNITALIKQISLFDTALVITKN